MQEMLTVVFLPQPIVISPEGSPHWLSREEVLAKGIPEGEVENFKWVLLNFFFFAIEAAGL